MLLGLRHPSIIGSDNEECQVDRADAGDHIFYEVFVAWYVNDSKLERGISGRGCGQLQVRKAKVDGDSSRFFFGKAVGINSGERLNQSTLAMIHVARGSNDEMLRIRHWKPVRLSAIRDAFLFMCQFTFLSAATISES